MTLLNKQLLLLFCTVTYGGNIDCLTYRSCYEQTKDCTDFANGQKCMVTCGGDSGTGDSCMNSIINCEPGKACEVHCIRYRACEGATINANQATSLKVTTSSLDAGENRLLYDANINCGNTNYCDITCTNRDNQCWGLYVNAESSGQLVVRCDGDQENHCQYSQFYCPKTTATCWLFGPAAMHNINIYSEMGFGAVNLCGTRNDGAEPFGTMHCESGYTQQCDIDQNAPNQCDTSTSCDVTNSMGCTAPLPTAPTTAEPTTAIPTTVSPTTATPTTADPTTATPTTTTPTTAAPTTFNPTTADPTTAIPTTVSPTTFNPTTNTPTTFNPTTNNPTTNNPTTNNPTTFNPTTNTPTTNNPTTFNPTTVIPTTAIPTTFNPTTFNPTTAIPTTFNPTTFNPTTVIPTTAIPTTNNPTAVPTTSIPTTTNPTPFIPTTAIPTTMAPTTTNPTTNNPTTNNPTTFNPTTMAPTTNNPTTYSPTTSMPTTTSPTTTSPTTSIPTTSTPTTVIPTKSPSQFPSISPSKFPSISPSKFPSISPSKYPSKSPTQYPSKSPTKYPSTFPSQIPSISPTFGVTSDYINVNIQFECDESAGDNCDQETIEQRITDSLTAYGDVHITSTSINDGKVTVIVAIPSDNIKGNKIKKDIEDEIGDDYGNIEIEIEQDANTISSDNNDLLSQLLSNKLLFLIKLISILIICCFCFISIYLYRKQKKQKRIIKNQNVQMARIVSMSSVGDNVSDFNSNNIETNPGGEGDNVMVNTTTATNMTTTAGSTNGYESYDGVLETPGVVPGVVAGDDNNEHNNENNNENNITTTGYNMSSIEHKSDEKSDEDTDVSNEMMYKNDDIQPKNDMITPGGDIQEFDNDNNNNDEEYEYYYEDEENSNDNEEDLDGLYGNNNNHKTRGQ